MTTRSESPAITPVEPAPAAGATPPGVTGQRRWVLDIGEGDGTMADLLGGKGAGLAQMVRLGLPVPRGFTVTTAACREYLATGALPADLEAEIDDALAALERSTGRRLGDPADPLVLSVRSGARFSMPGMMDTVLDIGVNDTTLAGLWRRGGERFAWDCYRRLLQMYGKTVLGAEGLPFEKSLAAARVAAGAPDDASLPVGSLQTLVARFRQIVRDTTGREVPQDPREQLRAAIRAVFESWNTPRARLYRQHEGIAEDLGTAVNVMEMVFGNTGPRSGSGVCFTRDPATGRPGAYGDYLTDAQGEDVVAGIRNTVPLQELAVIDPPVHAELLGHLRLLETHYRDVCDVEFTVEDGRLWILQTRVGKRTAVAAFRIAGDLVDEGLISLDDALCRVDGEQLSLLLHPSFAAGGTRQLLARGLPASPGAAVGQVVLDSVTATRWAAEGRPLVLVRNETSPDDLPGMVAAQAVVTARGGLTSHAAVVARGMGRACVTGAAELTIDLETRTVTGLDGVQVREGDLISVDGTSGEVVLGALPVAPSPLARAIEGELELPDPNTAEGNTDEAHGVRAVLRLLDHADLRRHLGVRANAETGPDAARARRLGGEGIGLYRTEHTLLGERRQVVEDLVMGDRREEALAELLELQRHDMTEVLEAMDGLPVVIRLLDPPLHEFLPDLTELAVEVAVQESSGGADAATLRRLEAVRRWHEHNPMLGLRGVRLVAVVPQLLEVQVRALLEAAAALRARGRHPRPELMVPLVADVAELAAVRTVVEKVVEQVSDELGYALELPLGAMIELPRAALTAGELATVSDFFSFGTNDLTQTTWGMSRDDAETGFLQAYRDSGLLDVDPFASIDTEGVGRLVRLATLEARAAHPAIGLGVCGEHGGDPASIHFFAGLGLDYVSCSPPRIPVARLEAGRAVVLAISQAGPDTR